MVLRFMERVSPPDAMMILDMTPDLPMNDLPDHLLTDTVLQCECGCRNDSWDVPSTDLLNVTISQFRQAVLFSTGHHLWMSDVAITFLLSHIRHVGKLVSEKEMPPTRVLDSPDNVDPLIVVARAERHVTGVEYAQVVRNGLAARQDPGDPMGILVSALPSNGSVGVATACRPEPAITGPIDVGAKDVGKGDDPAGDSSGAAACVTAIPGRPKTAGRLAVDTVPALRARDGNRGTIRLHREPPTRGAVPPDIRLSRGVLATQSIPFRESVAS